MACRVALILLGVLCARVAGAQDAQPAAQAQLIERIHSRLDAAGAGDAAKWGTFVLDFDGNNIEAGMYA